jgi:hypothetical protein
MILLNTKLSLVDSIQISEVNLLCKLQMRDPNLEHGKHRTIYHLNKSLKHTKCDIDIVAT